MEVEGPAREWGVFSEVELSLERGNLLFQRMGPSSGLLASSLVVEHVCGEPVGGDPFREPARFAILQVLRFGNGEAPLEEPDVTKRIAEFHAEHVA